VVVHASHTSSAMLLFSSLFSGGASRNWNCFRAADWLSCEELASEDKFTCNYGEQVHTTDSQTQHNPCSVLCDYGNQVHTADTQTQHNPCSVLGCCVKE